MNTTTGLFNQRINQVNKMNNYYDLIKWAKAEKLILRNKLNMVWGNGHYERDPIKQAMYFWKVRSIKRFIKIYGGK